MDQATESNSDRVVVGISNLPQAGFLINQQRLASRQCQHVFGEVLPASRCSGRGNPPGPGKPESIRAVVSPTGCKVENVPGSTG